MAENGQVREQGSKKPKSARLRWVVMFVAGVVVGCAGVCLLQTRCGVFCANRQTEANAKAAAEKKWAQRLELRGVPNFHKVSDELYRGAQPSAEGMRELKKLGIRTVVNLRSFHSDRDEIGDTGLAYEHIYMKPWHPEDKEVVRFLKIVTDERRTPVFVHCQRGADRTGTMCAIYRVAVQGWRKAEAIEEMTKGGFGYYPGWENLVNYILKLDVEEIKRRAGLNE
ncbi:MAG: dual specificity protein phosphatase family protein [Planctomycetota bacterium]|jgi:protein tyrosine phosphatase (PTP) superfamily phosphohydrolase (DUF442 family)